MKTVIAKKNQVARQTFLFDAKGQVLGRAASGIARILMGKHKPIFTQFIDTGDAVVVVNAEHIKVTGAKEQAKTYWHHTGYAGGERGVLLDRMRNAKPEDILKNAIQGMLPKGPLGRSMFRKLKVYKGPSHPHAAQKPEPLTF
ncbi:MAG: 50S ribosomal protein L13 [Pseudomonadota bacterium]